MRAAFLLAESCAENRRLCAPALRIRAGIRPADGQRCLWQRAGARAFVFPQNKKGGFARLMKNL